MLFHFQLLGLLALLLHGGLLSLTSLFSLLLTSCFLKILGRVGWIRSFGFLWRGQFFRILIHRFLFRILRRSDRSAFRLYPGLFLRGYHRFLVGSRRCIDLLLGHFIFALGKLFLFSRRGIPPGLTESICPNFLFLTLSFFPWILSALPTFPRRLDGSISSRLFQFPYGCGFLHSITNRPGLWKCRHFGVIPCWRCRRSLVDRHRDHRSLGEILLFLVTLALVGQTAIFLQAFVALFLKLFSPPQFCDRLLGLLQGLGAFVTKLLGDLPVEGLLTLHGHRFQPAPDTSRPEPVIPGSVHVRRCNSEAIPLNAWAHPQGIPSDPRMLVHVEAIERNGATDAFVEVAIAGTTADHRIVPGMDGGDVGGVLNDRDVVSNWQTMALERPPEVPCFDKVKPQRTDAKLHIDILIPAAAAEGEGFRRERSPADVASIFPP